MSDETEHPRRIWLLWKAEPPRGRVVGSTVDPMEEGYPTYLLEKECKGAILVLEREIYDLRAQLAQRDAQIEALQEAREEQEQWLHKMDAALKAADGLGVVAELLLRMMDDVTKGRDMQIVPDGSVTLVGAWKVLDAYQKARGQDAH